MIIMSEDDWRRYIALCGQHGWIREYTKAAFQALYMTHPKEEHALIVYKKQDPHGKFMGYHFFGVSEEMYKVFKKK